MRIFCDFSWVDLDIYALLAGLWVHKSFSLPVLPSQSVAALLTAPPVRAADGQAPFASLRSAPYPCTWCSRVRPPQSASLPAPPHA